MIEVSRTRSRFDRTETLQFYAEAKIAEVWQVNLPGRIVNVHRNPIQTISMQCLPHAKLVIADLFPAK